MLVMSYALLIAYRPTLIAKSWLHVVFFQIVFFDRLKKSNGNHTLSKIFPKGLTWCKASVMQ